MAKKKLELEVTFKYTIEIDGDSEIVQEYENEKELIEDLIAYRFSPVLPVINKGVEINDIETLHWVKL